VRAGCLASLSMSFAVSPHDPIANIDSSAKILQMRRQCIE
jgi:hypothetical protein